MDLGLKGKNALVTGGTRGIGRAIVETLLAEGANVAFCARNAELVEKTEKELLEKGRVIGTALDVSQKEPLKEWVVNMGNTLGGIDILISNAGAMVLKNNEEDWNKNFNVDLMAAVTMTNVAKPFLENAAIQKGDAAIIYISSIAAARAENENSYGPIKAALIHFAKGVATEQAPKKIRANVVSPGAIYIEEGYWGQIKKNNPIMFEDVVRRNPIGRMGTAKEIANAVVFLASPVSSYTTGINLIVDGAYLTRVNF